MSKSVKKSKKCRLYKDGNAWCCVGPKFVNIEESASGFGMTPEAAYNDYLEDVAAMKAAKKLVKAAKKAKKEVKPAKKFLDAMRTQLRVWLIAGVTPTAILIKAKKFNLTMECPLGDDDVVDMLNDLCAAKDWLQEQSGKEKPKKSLVSKVLKAGGRNNWLKKVCDKAFKNGTKRAAVIKLALAKNDKLPTPLESTEVIDIVRVSWEQSHGQPNTKLPPKVK